MVFAYYSKLSSKQKAIYRKSDAIGKITLGDTSVLSDLVVDLEAELKIENRAAIESIAREITKIIINDLNVPTVKVKVLAVRPSNDWGELHGLYEPAEKLYTRSICRYKHYEKYLQVIIPILEPAIKQLGYEI